MAFIIPTIFTAVDRVTGTVTRMNASMNSFANNSQRAFSAATPDVGAGLMKKLKYLKELGEAMVVITTAVYTGKAMMDFEAEIANLSAVTGAAGADLEKFKAIIAATAVETRRSSVDVAKSFTTIANAMPELLTDADGLSKVTKAAITLAKASRMDLQPAAAALTDILNQFSKSAADAAATTELLGAGAKYGSAEIRDLQDAITGFGKIADLSGITLKESIGLVELVSKFKKGANAGIELRNVIIEMNKNTAQDPKALDDLRRLGVNIALVADSTKPLADRLLELQKILHDSNALNHVFGKENIVMAATVLQNANNLKPLLANMDEYGVATAMAAKNSDTLIAKTLMLRDRWVTWVTTSSTAAVILNTVSGVIGFLTDHMSGLLAITAAIAGPMLLWKTLLIGAQIAEWGLVKAQIALNFVQGLGAVITRGYAAANFVTTASINGMVIASFFLEKGLLASLGIIGLVAAALALIANRFSIASDRAAFMNHTLRLTKDGFDQIVTPINNATAALLAYNKAVREYNDKKQEQAFDKYEIKNHPGKWFVNRLVRNMYFPTEATGVNDSIPVPKLNDYKDYDPKQIQKEYLPADTAPAQASVGNTGKIEDLLKDIRDGIRSNGQGRPDINIRRTQTGGFTA